MGEDPANDEGLQARMIELRKLHRELDDAIQAQLEDPNSEILKLARMKKEKLAIRDEIARLSEKLTPDIIA